MGRRGLVVGLGLVECWCEPEEDLSAGKRNYQLKKRFLEGEKLLRYSCFVM